MNATVDSQSEVAKHRRVRARSRGPRDQAALGRERPDDPYEEVRACRTAANYRLFALPRTSPPKPGLVRVERAAGPGIEVEVWVVPEDRFGGFVAAIPSPLAMGSLQLATGEWISGFVCEPSALEGAEDITAFGGWRGYLASRTAPAAMR